ncbi:hypothetical protein KC19_4G195500 [Ceratodon purpureus]|uniref:Uncharacterized protein n=1 Tax=Ceratodon purpureus TaxID=3225 RepID=A0A8T0IAH4_CERPU|nr:hypothetical protein KC19_4G195500 [Ceratodon purpureus]
MDSLPAQNKRPSSSITHSLTKFRSSKRLHSAPARSRKNHTLSAKVLNPTQSTVSWGGPSKTVTSQSLVLNPAPPHQCTPDLLLECSPTLLPPCCPSRPARNGRRMQISPVHCLTSLNVISQSTLSLSPSLSLSRLLSPPCSSAHHPIIPSSPPPSLPHQISLLPVRHLHLSSLPVFRKSDYFSLFFLSP